MVRVVDCGTVVVVLMEKLELECGVGFRGEKRDRERKRYRDRERKRYREQKDGWSRYTYTLAEQLHCTVAHRSSKLCL